MLMAPWKFAERYNGVVRVLPILQPAKKVATMRVLSFARRLTASLLACCGAMGLPSMLIAEQPCNCYPAPAMAAGGFAEGAPVPGSDVVAPPAVIIEQHPCVYKPYDVDPCYDMRCHLYPGSPPSWFYVQADYAPLFRDTARDVAFQSLDQEGPIVLGTQTLDMEFQGGLRLLVGGRVNEIYRVETMFQGFQHWADTDTARDFSPNDFGSEGNLFSPFSGFGNPDLNFDNGPAGIVGLDFNNSARLSLQTSYDSVESNVLVDIPRYRNLESAVSLGLRYTTIGEELTYATASAAPAAVGAGVLLENAVENDMLGLQLGYRARLLVEQRMWLDFDLRGAIYHNDIEHRLRYEQTQGAAIVGAFADTAEAEKTTFGGDLSLVMHYLVTPNFAVRLGYQALWFDSLALAAENVIPDGVRVTTPAGGPNTLVFQPLEIDHSGEVVYHGPVAGFVATW